MLIFVSMANLIILSTLLDFFDNRKLVGVLNLIKNVLFFFFCNFFMVCCLFMYLVN